MIERKQDRVKRDWFIVIVFELFKLTLLYMAIQ